MKNFLIVCFLAGLFLTACKKYSFDNTITGETISEFSLIAPAANTTIALNAATPNEKIVISWTAAKPGVNTAVKYKWVATTKGTANFEAVNRVLEIPSNHGGADTRLT
jgi:uncharacterized protein YndB with AHSA1/START domain